MIDEEKLNKDLNDLVVFVCESLVMKYIGLSNIAINQDYFFGIMENSKQIGRQMAEKFMYCDLTAKLLFVFHNEKKVADRLAQLLPAYETASNQYELDRIAKSNGEDILSI